MHDLHSTRIEAALPDPSATTLTAVLGTRHDVMDAARDVACVAQYGIARIRLQDLTVTDLAELPGMFF